MTAFLCPCSARQPASPTEELQLKRPMGTQKTPKYPMPRRREMLFLEINPSVNKQSPLETAEPGWSFGLPPDSSLCFFWGAGLKQRGPGPLLPTANRSCLAPGTPLPSPAFLQLWFPHCWCLLIPAGHGLSPHQQPNLKIKITYLGSVSICFH